MEEIEWKEPEWIALPAGNLGNTAAFGKAVDEAATLGLVDRIPRLLAVQAAGAAPFFASYATDFRERHSTRAETIATAIKIGAPASYDRGVRAIRLTRGAVVAVPDEAILDAQGCIKRAGIGCEPASAASVAGVRAAVKTGLIERDQSVVAILTGHLLKDPSGGADRNDLPIEVDPTLDAIERALS